MKILVPIKRVPDPETKFKVNGDGTGIATDNVKYVINYFDEIAVEEALRIKEGGTDAEVVVVCIDHEDATQQIRTALAMGADRGVFVKSDGDLDPAIVAEVLQKVIGEESPDFVIMGKLATDGENTQVGQILAYKLGWPQATFASEVKVDGGKITVVREVDGGLETNEVASPAIITTDLRLNEPRYASLPGIMKAKKKPLDEKSLGDLGVSAAAKVKMVKLEAPPAREAGKVVETVDELVDLLKNEAKVL